MEVKISIKSYPKEAGNLVDVWTNHSNGSLAKAGIGYIIFKNKRPKNPKTQNRRIAGLKAESISYLRDNEELVKMSVGNFCLFDGQVRGGY
jgi:hypothetical protein